MNDAVTGAVDELYIYVAPHMGEMFVESTLMNFSVKTEIKVFLGKACIKFNYVQEMMHVGNVNIKLITQQI